MNKNEIPFSDLFGTTSSAFLEEFESLDQIAESSIEELINFITEKSKNHTSNLNNKITALNKARKLLNININVHSFYLLANLKD